MGIVISGNKNLKFIKAVYYQPVIPPRVINFHIYKSDNINSNKEFITYQAMEGMTWGEWVDSEYNVDGFSLSSSYSDCREPDWETYYDGIKPPKSIFASADGIYSPNPGENYVVTIDKIVEEHIYEWFDF